jgi:two-component system OmpR family response regulator
MNKISQLEKQIASTHCILLAEDDSHIRRLSVKVLVDSGYRVDIAEDGEAAWNALQLKSYHLLITDNDMPKMSGIELVKKLRAVGMMLPVIMASGSMPMEKLNEQSRLQISAVLSKPHGLAKLLKTVKEVLGRGSQSDRIQKNTGS